MTMELVDYKNDYMVTLNAGSNGDLIDLTTSISECLDNIKQNTLRIGYLLKQIRDSKCYESGEYKSEVDYGEKVFGFKKSAIYSFMKLADLYLDDRGNMTLRGGDKFSPSQLEAMTSIPKERLEGMIESKEIKPTMTVKNIKEKVKEEKQKKKEENKSVTYPAVTETREKKKEAEKIVSLLSINVTQKGDETPVIVWNYGDESGTANKYKQFDEIEFAHIIEHLNSYIHDIQAKAKEYHEKVESLKGMTQEELNEYIANI